MDDRAKTARRNLDHASAVGENAIHDAQEHYAKAVGDASDLNAKLVEMMRANAEAAIEATSKIASCKNPADLAQVWSTYATKQFAMLADQGRELAAMWQNVFMPPS